MLLTLSSTLVCSPPLHRYIDDLTNRGPRAATSSAVAARRWAGAGWDGAEWEAEGTSRRQWRAEEVATAERVNRGSGEGAYALDRSESSSRSDAVASDVVSDDDALFERVKAALPLSVKTGEGGVVGARNGSGCGGRRSGLSLREMITSKRSGGVRMGFFDDLTDALLGKPTEVRQRCPAQHLPTLPCSTYLAHPRLPSRLPTPSLPLPPTNPYPTLPPAQ